VRVVDKVEEDLVVFRPGRHAADGIVREEVVTRYKTRWLSVKIGRVREESVLRRDRRVEVASSFRRVLLLLTFRSSMGEVSEVAYGHCSLRAWVRTGETRLQAQRWGIILLLLCLIHASKDADKNLLPRCQLA
jgi:hypothetical protein